MKIIDNIEEMKLLINAEKENARTIGLVPTMGYLHAGHISLVKKSKEENDFTVMSIFVNPTQFGPGEDYEKYPRDMKGDADKAEKAGVDVIFAPKASEMYPEGYNTYIEVFKITDELCGKSRPGHFRGVCTVVAKLFNITGADKAYFGQKDAQQAAVIKKMAKELNFNTQIVICPIVREADGLALSSRNVYLTSEERQAALVLSGSLEKAAEFIKSGENDVNKVLELLYSLIGNETTAEVDYIDLLDADTFEHKEIISGKIIIALAVRFGRTRLIDNMIIEVK